jgi:Xaa-Pro aminopeptidase
LTESEHAPLHRALRARVVRAIADADFDCLLLSQPENIGYVTGYRSMSETMKRQATMIVALDAAGQLHIVGPAADSGPLFHDAVIDAEYFVPYGRFYFESAGDAPASRTADVHQTLRDAAATLLARLGPVTLGLDADAAALLSGLVDATSVQDASIWMVDQRARKTATEIERLERAALVTEDAIESCVPCIVPGVTERQLARRIAGHISAAGGVPKFIVVTAGPRSALSDVAASDRAIERGDLVRFDIGCVVDDYWADIGRTMVIGPPDDLQRRRYDAILAGEQAQLDAAKPGMTAHELFHLAVDRVRDEGIAAYRRHHCGHAIGTEVYERPVIAPNWHTPLEEGMTFCFETPFYEIGWGGMMVEDTVVITADGCRRLNRSDRTLRIV